MNQENSDYQKEMDDAIKCKKAFEIKNAELSLIKEGLGQRLLNEGGIDIAEAYVDSLFEISYCRKRIGELDRDIYGFRQSLN